MGIPQDTFETDKTPITCFLTFNFRRSPCKSSGVEFDETITIEAELITVPGTVRLQKDGPMSQTENSVSTPERLPVWADEILWKYRAGEASHFLLYHNIYDLTHSRGGYVPLLSFLQQELLINKRVVFYNRSEGITFDSDETLRAFIAHERVANPQFNASAAAQLPRDPARALPMIERFLYHTDNNAVVINFLETVFPAGEIGHLSAKTAMRWWPFSDG